MKYNTTLCSLLSLLALENHTALAQTSSLRNLNSKKKNMNNIFFVDDNPNQKLSNCEGDCDSDDDCKDDLVCFHRNKGENKEVPGCDGGGKDGSRTDYCVDPDEPGVSSIEAQQKSARVGDGSPGPAIQITDNDPFGLCEGDCDKDDDCKIDLVCFHRDKDEKSDVPGCSGGSRDGSRTDYCISKTMKEKYDLRTSALLTYSGSSRAAPLGLVSLMGLAASALIYMW